MTVIVWVTTDHAYCMFYFQSLYNIPCRTGNWEPKCLFCEQEKCFLLPREHLGPDSFLELNFCIAVL